MPADESGLTVLIVGLNYSPEPTGIAPYTAGLAHALAERGHRISVRTGFPHYPSWRFEEGYQGNEAVETNGNVEIQRYRHHLPNPTRLWDRARMEVDFGLKACRQDFGAPDVVIAVSPALLASAIALTRARATRSQTAVGLWVQDLYGAGMAESARGSRRAAAVAKLESQVLRRADGIVAIHPRMANHIVTKLGVDPGRVSIVRNWTHIKPSTNVSRHEARKILSWGDDETIVLHAGAMGMKQDLRSVIEAARRSKDPRVRFVLLGDGSQRESLMDAANGLENVTFLRPISEDLFVIALTAADIMLVNEQPGMSEMSVPSKLTSYLASGRPVLAGTDSTSPAAHELKDSGGGVVVPPRSPDALNEAIARLQTDVVTSRELGQAGQRYSEQQLSMERAVDEFEAALFRLRARRSQLV